MKKCFVISPIGLEGSEIRKHADRVFKFIVEPAAKECGIDAVRSDHLDQPGRISEQMFRSIHESDLCVALLTGYNPNVFYELAVAQSALRPVIVLMEKSQELPFDIKDLRCVYYDLEIESINDRIYVKQIVNCIKYFEAANWQVTDYFGVNRPLGSRMPTLSSKREDVEFFETPSQFREKHDWLELLQRTERVFDVMGVSLTRWRGTKDFRKTADEKANDGCEIRVLLMHLENPILPDVTDDMKTQERNIQQNLAFFKDMAQENENIKIRQIRYGLPHFFLTRSDHCAVVIHYLNSQKWGSGPLWMCSNASALYGVLKREFDTLWDLNATQS